MSSAARVRDLIKELGHNVQFTTAQLLCCGSRNAVDIELCRLVAKGIIQRLANGVFIVRNAVTRIPSAFEIATTKAFRFGKRIIQPKSKIEKAEENNFFTNGCRSSFKSVHGRLYLKHLAPGRSTSGIPTNSMVKSITIMHDTKSAETNNAPSRIIDRIVQLEREVFSLSASLVRLFILQAGRKQGSLQPIISSHNTISRRLSYSRVFLN